MPNAEVTPVINLAVRGLCVKPYPLHPKGCPNFKHKLGCPPQAPQLDAFYDVSVETYVIWNAFALGAHVRSMRAKHPTWSERQLYCCLYWQPRARADLEVEIAKFMEVEKAARWVSRCPEAMGLDVTATMRTLGITLEWPPVETAYQVAFAGIARLAWAAKSPSELARESSGQMGLF
jgi:hypothetical protein